MPDWVSCPVTCVTLAPGFRQNSHVALRRSLRNDMGLAGVQKHVLLIRHICLNTATDCEPPRSVSPSGLVVGRAGRQRVDHGDKTEDDEFVAMCRRSNGCRVDRETRSDTIRKRDATRRRIAGCGTS